MSFAVDPLDEISHSVRNVEKSPDQASVDYLRSTLEHGGLDRNFVWFAWSPEYRTKGVSSGLGAWNFWLRRGDLILFSMIYFYLGRGRSRSPRTMAELRPTGKKRNNHRFRMECSDSDGEK